MLACQNKSWFLKHYVDTQLSAKEIAGLINCSETTIFRRLKKFDISSRTPKESHFGHIAWNKGLTKETDIRIKKCSESKIGIKRPPFSKEWIENLSKAHQGRQFSKEHKRRMSEAQKGEKSYNWKGGITPYRTAIWKSESYQEWRNAVFKQDNYTCVRCLNHGGKLHAHHILSFADFLEERFEPDNGATLCKSCHLHIHKYELNE